MKNLVKLGAVIGVVLLLAGCENTYQFENDWSESVVSEQETSVNSTWYEGKTYVSETTGATLSFYNYSEGGDIYILFGTVTTPMNSGNMEVIKDKELGTIIGYTFQTQSLRNGTLATDEYYVLYYVETDTVGISNKSCSYSDKFSAVATSHPSFYDGQKFQCFSTVSEEDLFLEIKVFTENEVRYYKAELSNGIEFWFDEQWTDGNYYVTQYNAYFEYDLNLGQLELISEDSYLRDYAGVYIQLPDQEEE